MADISNDGPSKNLDLTQRSFGPEPAEIVRVAEVAMALLELPAGGDVFACVADALHRICGPDVLLFVSSCDGTRRRFRPQAMRGAGAVLERVTSLVGLSPMDIEGDFPDEIKPALASGRLLSVAGGPLALAISAVPEFVASRAISLLGLHDAYVIGFAKRGDLFGGVTIVTRKPEVSLPAAAIETVARLGSIALERHANERALRVSEERLRLSLEATRDGVWDRNVLTGEVYYSPAYWGMLGYAPEEQTGQVEAWRALIHPDDRDATLAAIDGCIGSSTDSFAVEFRMRGADGRFRWIRGRGKAAERDARGRATRVVGIHTDITGRKEAELALARSAERFERWMKASFIGVMVFDRTGRLLTCNDALLAMLGYERRDMTDGRIPKSALTPPESVAVTERAQVEVLRTGSCAPFEKKFHRKDGTAIPVLVGGATLGVEPPEYIFFAVDLSERERLQAQLLKAQRMETIGTFAGGIAHDFNNLLTGIRGLATLIERGAVGPPDLRTDLEDIHSLVEQGAGLTRQLLGFAGRGKYDPQSVSPSALVEGVAKLFVRTHKDIVVHESFVGPEAAVFADPTQLEQVVLNLLVNAADAMPGGGELSLTVREVRLGAEVTAPHGLAQGTYAEISVADTGTGMDESVRQRVFEPFFTTKPMGQGTGLGLASAYGIVANHSGFITVESQLGAGSTFRVYLPLSEQEVAPRPSPPNEKVEGRRELILVVDDEAVVARVTERLLQSAGYSVLVAHDGAQAIEHYRTRGDDIALVLLDMVMPGLSGSATFDVLRSINPDVKVLLASGYSSEGQATELLARGCNGFIQKPYRKDELAAKVSTLLVAVD